MVLFLAAFLNPISTLEQNESGAFATARVKIPDLAQLQTPLEKISDAEGLGLDEFSLLGGELKVKGIRQTGGKLPDRSFSRVECKQPGFGFVRP